MPEIRDKVIDEIMHRLGKYATGMRDEGNKRLWAESILSIPEIATVDREAELPAIPEPPIYSNRPYNSLESQAFRVGAITYRISMLNEGWIKENK